MRLEIVIIILGMAAVTFLTRYTCLALFNRSGVPGWLERWLKNVPTSILTALIVPALLLPRGVLDLTPGNHHLMAGCVAALTAYVSRNVIATMTLGLATMFILRWLGS